MSNNKNQLIELLKILSTMQNSQNQEIYQQNPNAWNNEFESLFKEANQNRKNHVNDEQLTQAHLQEVKKLQATIKRLADENERLTKENYILKNSYRDLQSEVSDFFYFLGMNPPDRLQGFSSHLRERVKELINNNKKLDIHKSVFDKLSNFVMKCRDEGLISHDSENPLDEVFEKLKVKKINEHQNDLSRIVAQAIYSTRDSLDEKLTSSLDDTMNMLKESILDAIKNDKK